MPTYCYRREDNDEIVELTMSIDEMLRTQEPDGRMRLEDGTMGSRHYGAESAKPSPSACWPQVCTIDGIDPADIPQARAEARAAGIDVDFTPEGGPIHKSRKERKRYYEHIGMHDLNAGYGDPVQR